MKSGQQSLAPVSFQWTFSISAFPQKKIRLFRRLTFSPFQCTKCHLFHCGKNKVTKSCWISPKMFVWVHVIVITTATNYCFVLGTTSNFRCVWVKAIRNLSHFKGRKNLVLYSLHFSRTESTSRGHSLWVNLQKFVHSKRKFACSWIAAATTAILVVYSKRVLCAW